MMRQNCLFRRLILAVFLLALYLPASAHSEDYDNSPDRSKWMANLRDDTPLCRVSIPGAHDALTGAVRVAGSTCQTYDIGEMFDKGVRFFDFRVAAHLARTKYTLMGYHGFVVMSYWFDTAMGELFDRIKNNKDEIVLIHVSQESGTNPKIATDPNWAKHVTWKLMCAYFDRNDGKNGVTDNTYFNDFWKDSNKGHEFDRYHEMQKYLMPFRPDLTVGEARGKIVYMLKDDMGDKDYDFLKKNWKNEYYADLPFVHDAPGDPGKDRDIIYWGKDPVSGKAKVLKAKFLGQNNDEVYDCFEKYGYIEKQFEFFDKFVKDHPDSLVWNFNYISGWEKWLHTALKFPDQREIATYCNRLSTAYIGSHPNSHFGIIAMDWCCVSTAWGYTMAGDVLVDAVINNNWKYWKDSKDSKDSRGHYEIPTSYYGDHNK